MKVLVACEESQRVCIAFRDKGHLAFSCDIKPTSGSHPEWHLQCDVLSIINAGWDLIIAHPPCTFLTKAGARWLYHRDKAGNSIIDDERLSNLLLARSLFMSIYNADCPRICIENPTPLKIANLPDYTQVVQPYQFGHPYSKRTLLWLKGLPPLKPTDVISDFAPYLPSNTSMFSRGLAGGSRGVCKNNSCERSKTFLGIALAMADQWG